MNKLLITGNAGADAKVGDGWLRLSVATNDGFMKDGVWQDRTNWFSCFVKGSPSNDTHYLAKKAAKIKKGDRLLIEGSVSMKPKEVGDEKFNIASVNVYKIENFGKFNADEQQAATADKPKSDEPEDLPF